jgi:hypothetical protein
MAVQTHGRAGKKETCEGCRKNKHRRRGVEVVWWCWVRGEALVIGVRLRGVLLAAADRTSGGREPAGQLGITGSGVEELDEGIMKLGL